MILLCASKILSQAFFRFSPFLSLKAMTSASGEALKAKGLDILATTSNRLKQESKLETGQLFCLDFLIKDKQTKLKTER